MAGNTFLHKQFRKLARFSEPAINTAENKRAIDYCSIGVTPSVKKKKTKKHRTHPLDSLHSHILLSIMNVASFVFTKNTLDSKGKKRP